MTMTFKEALIAHLQGKKVQIKKFAEWKTFDQWLFDSRGISIFDCMSDGFANACQFRLAPRTILVNGVEVPAPEKEAPGTGIPYFVPSITTEDLYTKITWDGGRADNLWLERYLVYLCQESAIARAKAMLITQEVK